MNRADRRRRMKEMRLRVVKGEKPPSQPQVDTATPAGLLAQGLDVFLKQRCAADKRLDPATVLAVLLQMTAGLIVELRVPASEVYQALDTFVERELVARAPAPTTEEPG